jgi:(2R)-ethylmalonyl-CoA mutase
VSAVFTPKDYGITEIMRQMVQIVRTSNGLD